MNKRGIDVAHWEPIVNWLEVKGAGYEFAFIKASQGSVPDHKFVEHWNNARGIMQRGPYHFYDPRYPGITPEVQAEKFWDMIYQDPGELTPVVDIEMFTAGPYHGAEYWYRYISRLHSLSGMWPIIYTGYYYWNDNVRINPVDDLDWFARCPLWIAAYGNAPMIPKPWTDWTYWQYSESGTVKGVYDELGRLTECDLDYSKETTTEEHAMEYFKVSAVSNIRSAPRVSPDTDLGTFNLLVGDVFESDKSFFADNYVWLSLTRIWRGAQLVTMAPSVTGEYWVARTQYVTLTSFTPPVAGKKVTHKLTIYNDGSLDVDGQSV
jgi:lysozyme